MEDLIFDVNTTLQQVHERGGLLLFYRSFKTTTNLLDRGLLVCLNINRLLNGRQINKYKYKYNIHKYINMIDKKGNI